MKQKFSLDLVKLFNYYCDVEEDEEICKFIIKMLVYINDDFSCFEYYLKKIKNQKKLIDLMIDNIIESLGDC